MAARDQELALGRCDFVFDKVDPWSFPASALPLRVKFGNSKYCQLQEVNEELRPFVELYAQLANASFVSDVDLTFLHPYGMQQFLENREELRNHLADELTEEEDPLFFTLDGRADCTHIWVAGFPEVSNEHGVLAIEILVKMILTRFAEEQPAYNFVHKIDVKRRELLLKVEHKEEALLEWEKNEDRYLTTAREKQADIEDFITRILRNQEPVKFNGKLYHLLWRGATAKFASSWTQRNRQHRLLTPFEIAAMEWTDGLSNEVDQRRDRAAALAEAAVMAERMRERVKQEPVDDYDNERMEGVEAAGGSGQAKIAQAATVKQEPPDEDEVDPEQAAGNERMESREDDLMNDDGDDERMEDDQHGWDPDLENEFHDVQPFEETEAREEQAPIPLSDHMNAQHSTTGPIVIDTVEAQENIAARDEPSASSTTIPSPVSRRLYDPEKHSTSYCIADDQVDPFEAREDAMEEPAATSSTSITPPDPVETRKNSYDQAVAIVLNQVPIDKTPLMDTASGKSANPQEGSIASRLRQNHRARAVAGFDKMDIEMKKEVIEVDMDRAQRNRQPIKRPPMEPIIRRKKLDQRQSKARDDAAMTEEIKQTAPISVHVKQEYIDEEVEEKEKEHDAASLKTARRQSSSNSKQPLATITLGESAEEERESEADDDIDENIAMEESGDEREDEGTEGEIEEFDNEDDEHAPNYLDGNDDHANGGDDVETGEDEHGEMDFEAEQQPGPSGLQDLGRNESTEERDRRMALRLGGGSEEQEALMLLIKNTAASASSADSRSPSASGSSSDIRHSTTPAADDEDSIRALPIMAGKGATSASAPPAYEVNLEDSSEPQAKRRRVEDPSEPMDTSELEDRDATGCRSYAHGSHPDHLDGPSTSSPSTSSPPAAPLSMSRPQRVMQEAGRQASSSSLMDGSEQAPSSSSYIYVEDEQRPSTSASSSTPQESDDDDGIIFLKEVGDKMPPKKQRKRKGGRPKKTVVKIEVEGEMDVETQPQLIHSEESQVIMERFLVK